MNTDINIQHIGHYFVKNLIRDLSPVNVWQIKEVVFSLMLKEMYGIKYYIINPFGSIEECLRINGYIGKKADDIIEKISKACSFMSECTISGNDVFGDVYEYLLAYYTGDGGSAGGEFYTPSEVSELLAEIVVVGKEEVNKVYDPACGSGSLLLKFAKVLGKDKVRQGFFGQEINITTQKLCVANMLLHGIERFDIAHGDTLTDPKHMGDEPFDVIVSNPPYSIKWEGDANPLMINDPRFSPAGVLAPKSKADLAFVMHCLAWLAPSGTAAIVAFPGVLYRGGAEQKIRKYLVENNYIDTVIQLPPDLFFGTSIATCIIVLKKSKSDNATLFIDASAEFVRGGNKNKLSDANRQRILEAFIDRKDQAHFARLVRNQQIADNDYNLSVRGYVEHISNDTNVEIKALTNEVLRLKRINNAKRDELDKFIEHLEKDINGEVSNDEQTVLDFD